MKKNHVLWFIALLVVNTGWYFVSHQSASQEINRPGADFSPEREAKVGSILGSSVNYELEHCFASINGGVHEVSIKVESDSTVIYSWNGTTDDGCITYSAASDEGTLLIITELEDGAETTTTLYTWPLKSALLPGIVLFSIGTLVVAYGEITVRALITKKLEKIESEHKKTLQNADSTETSTSAIWQDPMRPQ